MQLTKYLTAFTLLAAPATAQWTTSSLIQDRYSALAVSVGDYALFAGGRDQSASFSSIDVYHEPTETWSTANLTVPRSVSSATVLGGLAFFAGGETIGNVLTDSVEIYDSSVGPPSDAAAWSVATLSVPRSRLAAASVGTKAMFAGGLGAGPSNVVDIYDSLLGAPDDPAAWSTETLSLGRVGLVGTSVGSQILFAGGATAPGSGIRSRVDIYDDVTGLWSIAFLSKARVSIGATSAGTLAYFAGGAVSAGSSPSTVVTTDVIDVYDSQTGLWSTPFKLSLSRFAVAATVVGDMLVFAGGALDGAIATDVVDAMDLNSGRFFEPLLLSTKRSGVAATSIGNQAILAGGSTGFDPVTFQAFPSGRIDILEPCASLASAEVLRLGSPPNPVAFLPGVSGGPVLGMAWDPVIDHTSFAPSAVLDYVLINFNAPSNIVTSIGTLLCPLGAGSMLFSASPGQPFALSIPYDCNLQGFTAYTQGASMIPGLGLRVTNALDITVGSL
jgi:hypothetical protein